MLGVIFGKHSDISPSPPQTHTLVARTRHPLLPGARRSSIGFWYTAFNALGFVAVLTNCGLLVSMSTYVDAYLPDDLDFLVRGVGGQA